jgi:PST family polysaccharide transporter
MMIPDKRSPEETNARPDKNVARDPDDHFSTDHLTGDIQRRSARGGMVTVAAQGAKLVLQLGATAVLARILTPADFGIYAMVAVFTGVLIRFRDLGLSAATIQRAEIDHQQVSTLFWVNVAAGVGLMLLSAALAPFLVWFYGEEALFGITLALSVVFLTAGFNAQHIALMRRQMRFTALASVEVGSMCFGIVAAVIVAYLGGRYWAPVVQAIGQSFAMMVLCFVVSKWRPGRWHWNPQVVEMLRFGGTITAANMVNFVSRNFDNLVIGRFSGATELGIYSKAYALLLVPVQQINGPIAAVAIPAMARLQDRAPEYRRYYLKVVQIIAYISMPVSVLLAVLADEVVYILLGPQWHDAAVIFQIFALYVVVQNVAMTTGWVLQSLGRVSRLFKWQGVNAAIYVVCCLIGVQWGAVGVAVVTTALGVLSVVPEMWYSYRHSPISVSAVLSVIVKPTLLAASLFAVTWYVHNLSLGEPMMLRIGEVLGAAAVFLGLVVLFVGPVRRDLLGMLSVLRSAKA